MVGYEVVRGGLGYSTRYPKLGDKIERIVLPGDRGTSRGRVGGGGSSRRITTTPKESTVIVNGSTVMIDGVGYTVAPSLQAEFIRGKTGGVGSSAQEAIKKVEAHARLEKYQQEIQGRVARQNVTRIAALRNKILSKGGTTIVRNSRDAKTGDQLRIENTIIGTRGERVFKVTNLNTGITTYKTYETPKGGGRAKLTGQFSVAQPKRSDVIAQKNYKLFQRDLNRINLPKGVSFKRDNKGNIIGINDNNRGLTLGLEDLPDITKAYLFYPNLKKVYVGSDKEIAKSLLPATQFNKLYPKKLSFKDKFSPNKWIDYVNDKSYYFYKSAGGGLNKTDYLQKKYESSRMFGKEKEIYDKWKKANSREHNIILQSLNKSIKDQIQNPESYGTKARITALLTIGGAAGGSTAILTGVGSAYFGTLGIAKEVTTTKLPKNFKNTALIVAKNFGYGAVQGLIYGTMFGAGSTILKRLGKPLIKMTFKKAATRGVNKATQLAIQRGLSIFGMNYVSQLAGRTTFNIKNIVVGEQEKGIAGISKDVGTLVGFSLPLAGKKIFNKVKNRKVNQLKKDLVTIQKYREGSMNAAYLKAKNAQLKGSTSGRYSSLGKAGNMPKTAFKDILKYAKKKGFSKKDLVDASYYVQQTRIKSDVPKWDALIKIYKGLINRKPVKKIKSVPNYYEFKRYGVVITKANTEGVTKSFAIEFNLVGRKPTYIGFKTGVGKGKYARINVFKKARAVKGKGLRTRLTDVYISKGRLETINPKYKDFMVELNKINTKKVFLNGKQLSKRSLFGFKKAMKDSLSLSKNKNLEKYLKKLYKNEFKSSTAIKTNSIRIKKVKNTWKVDLLNKKSPVLTKINTKGRYIEIGYSRFRIPSIKKLKFTKSKSVKGWKKMKGFPKTTTKTKTLTIKKKLKNVKSFTKGNTITLSAKKGNTITLSAKKGSSKSKIRLLESKIKSIQTIVKTKKRGIKIKPLSVFKVSQLIGKLSILLPSLSTASASKVKSIQALLKELKSIQQLKNKNVEQLKQQKVLQSASVKAIKTIKFIPKIITPITPTRPKRNVTRKPIEEKPIKIPILLKGKEKKKKRRIKTGQGYTTSSNINKKVKSINKLPLTKERALDILAYNLDKTKSYRGRAVKSIKKVTATLLNRQLKSVPKGYFKRNRKKFILKRLKKWRETFEVIEKKKYRKDNKKERSVKKKIVKKRKRIVKRKPIKKRKIIKRRRTNGNRKRKK